MRFLHVSLRHLQLVLRRSIGHIPLTGPRGGPSYPRMKMSLITHLRSAMEKRAAYRRTLNELRGIPAHLADDLNLQPGDAERLARQAVYG